MDGWTDTWRGKQSKQKVNQEQNNSHRDQIDMTCNKQVYKLQDEEYLYIIYTYTHIRAYTIDGRM